MRPAVSENLLQDRCVTGIVGLEIIGVSDTVEKSFEAGIAVSFSGLFSALGEPG